MFVVCAPPLASESYLVSEIRPMGCAILNTVYYSIIMITVYHIVISITVYHIIILVTVYYISILITVYGIAWWEVLCIILSVDVWTLGRVVTGGVSSRLSRICACLRFRFEQRVQSAFLGCSSARVEFFCTTRAFLLRWMHTYMSNAYIL